ncbi:MAG: hypothetical protein Q7R78_01240 [bacterium]|nr:hypothetical protein [bacterium]
MIKSKRKNGSILLETIFALFISIMISVTALEFVNDFSKVNNSADSSVRFRNYAKFVGGRIDEIVSELSFGLESFPENLSFSSSTMTANLELNQKDNFSGSVKIKIKDLQTGYMFNEDKYVFSRDYLESEQKCYIDFSKISDFDLVDIENELGNQNFATGIIAKGDLIFVSTNSTIVSDPDLYIYSLNEDDVDSPKLILESSLNTGPGLNSLSVVGNYLYVANTGSAGQMQVIDVSDIKNPELTSSIKVASSTVKGVSVYYHKEHIYLGTTKSASTSELFIFDSNTRELKNSYETNTQINAILAYKNYLLLATPNDPQLRILDIADPDTPIYLDGFTPSGFQTQEGNTISRDRNNIYFGRTVGGFNNINNHELFLIDGKVLPSIDIIYSNDIGSSVYGVVGRDSDYIVAVGLHESGIRIKDIFIPFDSAITDMKCFRNNLFVTSKESKGLRLLIPKYE